jgi:hypothetical protein
MNEARLATAVGKCEAYVLGGGIDAWRLAGLPTSRPAGETGQGGSLMGRLAKLFR